jgi:LytS/YehU family sensor histidine kinase
MFSDKIIISILAVTFTIFVLIIGIIIIILIARRQDITHQLNEALYQNKLNEVSLSALRAQMNPHFIFNCLNSIKLYTEQNNNVAASEYIDKFSRLIRHMLDNARTGKTSLTAEVETLTLYLEMEQMRFKDKLQYEIILNKNIDADFIEIPSLLIQPYVENSVWHGIMYKETGGKVTINIEQNDDANMLLISVKDDGIGREKAQLWKSKSEIAHKSHGTQISNDRIALLNGKDKTYTSVHVTDLFDNNNNPQGTLVTLKLSIK